jgi:subtilisin family serine protease
LLESDEDVLTVEKERYVHAALVPDDTYWSSQWGPAKIKVPSAWDVTMGDAGIVIAVVDSGIDIGHEDLSDNLWVNTAEWSGTAGADDDGNGYVDDLVGWSFVNGGSNDISDAYGHGTHVAGIAAAEGNNRRGIAGVCWDCRLMTLRVLDSSGNGTYSDVAEAVVYAVNNGARIINLSLGGEPYSQQLEDAVEFAYDHNVLVVAAAGNYGESVLYPAAYDSTFAVAASGQDDRHASYSNDGPQVDVSAPGSSIYSTCTSNRYCTKTGTSMATPHVSGLAGLIWSKHYTYTVPMVTQLIVATAVDIDEPGWDEKTGWGRIDAQRALMHTSTTFAVYLPLFMHCSDNLIGCSQSALQAGH